ncbi:MAG: 2-hydroxyacid dehydrogenase [Betaproteobacteria bacterium]|jgi:glyoxylate/hydroxypyruvate reductase A|nr:glyoxylate/hydroxypyruvate reductase A [Rhodocyclaceae bacterium]MCA3134139.1 glyoxylate/hydroxypyruvate reductase A [Rhodocyclaceae bacterium]MCA3142569.1 glyoxylate/hydroxypyruvate reductase A [Rhodocyclaceae bacterium]MCA3144318.1 glyoxylate/hydroxypyruvate reductase A [Rhodocyclaceae bacterium]MCE2897382.1 glyoxylate/hydroxypyruvate reductase A [Betaproteobacteria bacterium]
MSLVFYSLTDDPQPWREALARALPALPFHVWPQVPAPEAVHYTLVWKPPRGWHRQFPNLRAILSLGAGVDALLEDPDLPAVPITRLVDGGLARQMAEYALYAVLHFHRRMPEYARQQRARQWRILEPNAVEDSVVGVLGLGVLGAEAARLVAAAGFPVCGWSRTPRRIPGVDGLWGEDGLAALQRRARIVVNFLPLTPATRGLLDARFFSRLQPGACLVNVARGAHLVEADLLAALDGGHLGGAMLDVFAEEPLPPGHPFWTHPRVVLTPHVAGITLAAEAAAQVIQNLRRLEAGEPPQGVVDRSAGY